jgi:hypothetical protein
LKQRVEAAGRLVEDEQIGAVHERLDHAELLAVALGELADRAVEDRSEPCAELFPEWRVRPAQAGQRVELRPPGEPVRQAEITREVADAAPRIDRRWACVHPEQRRAPRCGQDQTQQEPDGRRFPRPIGA